MKIDLDLARIIDAAIPIRLGLDLHLPTCETARAGSMLACAECGRAMWMHGTRHDTCTNFMWITKHTITDDIVRKLMTSSLPVEFAALCTKSLDPSAGIAWDARRRLAAVISQAKNLVYREMPRQTTEVRATIGVTDHVVLRRALANGTYETQLELTGPVIGRGNTRREAAKHLADQLRTIATAVAGIEGGDTLTRTPI